MITTRFAPSPTGYLHLGHAASALLAAREGQTFLLRIEDIDPVRCKAIFTDALFEDLAWLGLRWPTPVRHQSQHMAAYKEALDKLKERDLVYPCFCTRRDVAAEAQEAAHAPHTNTVVYAGTCRDLSPHARAEKWKTTSAATWRLNVQKALAQTGPLFWHDRLLGKREACPQDFGDVVLARKDVPTSYHLSVTVDDHRQGVTLVTRGEDLYRSTDVHRLLQALLGYETPAYYHHPLLTDSTGRRYAKRDQSITLRALRAQGITAEDIKKTVALPHVPNDH